MITGTGTNRRLCADLKNEGGEQFELIYTFLSSNFRFTEVRSTQQGRLEERLPFFSFIFPSWFESKYPEALNNFRGNARRLTTPFDVHETLKNVLHFDGAGQGALSDRAISLFKEVTLALIFHSRRSEMSRRWCVVTLCTYTQIL